MTEQTPNESNDVPTVSGADVSDAEANVEDSGLTTAESVDAATASDAVGSESDENDDDLGAGAFDVPEGEAKHAADDSETTSTDEAHDTKPSKAYLGRPELTPLYAMAGLADLAAAVVRDIANEQIAAYRARRAKAEESTAEGGAEATAEDLREKVAEGTQEANAQFNAFLTKAQQRTQEIFEQAVAQYEHLADRGRVAVGDALDTAKQQRAKAEEKVSEGTQEGVDEFSAAAQKFADKVTELAQAAADRVTQATSASSPASAASPDGAAEASDGAEAAEAPADVPPAAATDAETSAESTTWDNNDGKDSTKQD